jgi:transposase
VCPIPYYTMIRSADHKQTVRRELVRFAQKHGIKPAARHFACSRNTVRKWLRRSEAQGSVEEQSRRPRNCPAQVDCHIEQTVLDSRRKTRYGPHRLSDWLKRTRHIEISPWTMRNILKRNGLLRRRKKRSTCYPAHWAWEPGRPFTLVQADVKDVYDKGTLGTERTTHLARLGLPRYQWTFLEAQSRLRFLAYSHRLTRDCGVAFLWLCLKWLQHWAALPQAPVQIQTDWGEEFGGDNPARIEQLNRKYFQPLGARLCRYPLGRKGYNGRVERLHRSDDEELYMPTLLEVRDTAHYLHYAFRWQAFYNLYRPHYGVGMKAMTPIGKLRSLGLDLGDSFALISPVVLDKIAGPIVAQGGHHVQAHYIITAPAARTPTTQMPPCQNSP